MEISVVIPVYNRAHMIGKALDSLVAQTYTDFEVIIVDDGSTDNICKVISNYNEQLEIKYVALQHTGNIAMLRNVGLYLSTSKYIAILDSDDWCVNNRLERQVDYMNHHEECDILSTWVHFEDEIVNENTRRLEWLYNMPNSKDEMIKRFLNDGCCICNSTVLMKREKIVELGGYDETMLICEDFNLWMRAIIKDLKIHVMPEKLLFRKLHKESVTSGYDGSSLSIQFVLKNKFLYLCETNRLSRNIVIWGINSRNKMVLEELKGNNISEVTVIDVYNTLPTDVDAKAFHLITTFTKKDEISEHLRKQNLKIVEDFIYS